MQAYFPTQTTGFSVITCLANGHEKGVYWAADLKEALNYAEMVVEKFGHQMSVRVENNGTGSAVASWAGQFISNGMPLNHWVCA